MSRFQEIKNRLAKECKGINISIMSEKEDTFPKEYFPTPSYDLNRILTGSLFKGVGSRTFTLLVGPEASFKSSFMCLCAAEAQRQGYIPLVIDTEGAWTGEFMKRWGMNPDEVISVDTPWVEEVMLELANHIENKDQKLCIILDSIGGLETSKMIVDATDKGDVKADQGQLTRKIKRAIKMLLNIAKNQDSIAFASAHLYANVSGYGGDSIGGGNFVKLGPDTIIQLKKSKLQDTSKEKNVIGCIINATTIKNRFYPAYSEAVVEIDYTNGINPMAGMVDLAIKAGLIVQGGAWYTNTLNGEKFQGEANVEKAITPEMLVALDTWIKDTGYSTYNKNVAAVIEAIETGEETPTIEKQPEEPNMTPKRTLNIKR